MGGGGGGDLHRHRATPCELTVARQYAAADVVQACAPNIIVLGQWLLQPHLNDRALLYAPKFFTQVTN